ncbi:MAG: D-alanyl-D-alanine carboxypeptidase family protein [bacterium]
MVKLRKYKKILLILSIGIAFGAVVFYLLINKPAETKKEVIVANSSSKKIVKENIEKYHPKSDWQKTHPSNIELTAESAIIIDQDTGQLILAKNEHQKLPPASITKVLTLLIVLENMKTDKLCTVSEQASSTQPNKITMKAGEKLKVEDLLYGMMMISANDAAEVLAECYDGGRTKFIGLMNDKIKYLGLKDSTFKDPNGLNDTEQVSSAYDMGTITRYAIITKPEVLKYMGRKEDYSVYPTETNESHSWYQISHLLSSFAGMEGAKTGYTHIAKNTYIGVASRGGRRIIIVYLSAQTTTSDATTMLEYGFSNKPN